MIGTKPSVADQAPQLLSSCVSSNRPTSIRRRMYGRPVPHPELSSLSPGRREAVVGWLAQSIGPCVACDAPVRRDAPHEARKSGFAHLQCNSVETPAAAADGPASLAVAARARRADWG